MISVASQYALRAMASLASSANEEPVLARTLSTTLGIPHYYLSKLMMDMTKAGLLKSNRGRGGGYRLALPAKEIPLVDVVEIFDGIKARPACLLEVDRICSDDNSCSAHESFKKVRQLYIEFLESTTIADIKKPPNL